MIVITNASPLMKLKFKVQPYQINAVESEAQADRDLLA